MAVPSTKSVDEIVREILLEKGLPLHYYVRILYWAQQEIDELLRRYGGNAKRISLDKTDYQRASLPDGLVNIVDVSFKNAERLQSLPFDSSLNLQYNYNDDGTKAPHPSSDDIWSSGYILYYDSDNLSSSANSNLDFVRQQQGGFYGLAAGQDFRWNVDVANGELVFSNNITDDAEIVLTYVPETVSSSTANVLEHHYVRVVKNYVHYQMALHGNAHANRVEQLRREYINAKRVMKAYVQPLSYSTLLYEIRQGYHAAPKS